MFKDVFWFYASISCEEKKPLMHPYSSYLIWWIFSVEPL